MKREIIQKGVRKSVPSKHADILVKLGKAVYADAVQSKEAIAESKAVVAEILPQSASEDAPKVKRTYRRRDMQSAETK